MAKRNTEQGGATDKAKVRVLFAEVEGNNESVQEALRTMVSAMSRPLRVVADGKVNGTPAALTQSVDADETDVSAQESVDESMNGSQESEEASNARRPRGSGKKVDRNAGLALVADLNFRPSGKQPLREFVDGKAPKNDVEAVAVVVHYMQHVMKLNKIGPSHVMTALKEVGRPVPADLRQTMRNLKDRRMWINFTDIEDVRMTTQGDNSVEHDMPAN